MPPRVLTEAYVAALKPRPNRYEAVDTRATGLRIVVQPSGSKGWQFRYRADGRRLSIGPYPAITLADARRKALEAAAAVASGVDPAAVKQAEKAAAKAAATVVAPAVHDRVEDVVDQFIERHAKAKTRDWRETERKLRKDIVPAWRGRRLSEITRADVHALLDQMIDRGAPVGANRTFAQIRKMCGWAMQRGLIERNPCDGITPPSAESSRDRALSDSELVTVWQAAGRIGFPFGPIVRLLILTGQRRDEVGGMKWSEVDLDNRLWIIPPERSKNRRQHAVPLSDAALELISGLDRFDSDFLFSAGKNPPSGWSKAKPRLDKAVLDVLDGGTLPHWVLHDIRRSVATGLGRLGVDVVVIERCLNHISGSFAGIVGVYQRQKYEAEVREALNRWARHVEGLVGQGVDDANVFVQIGGSRR